MPSRSFLPIPIDDYVRKHLAGNRGVDRSDLIERLNAALASARAGVRCECGERIRVIGSAEVGLSCLTCITGEAAPSDDYEIAEAIFVEDG
jgi:hypothetical protein